MTLSDDDRVGALTHESGVGEVEVGTVRFRDLDPAVQQALRERDEAVALLENMNYCFSPDTTPVMYDGSATDVQHDCGDCDGCNIKAFLGRIDSEE